MGLDCKTFMSYHFPMMKLNELREQLNKRKSEWTYFAKQISVSRKTIERTAAGKTNPRSDIVEKLTELLTA